MDFTNIILDDMDLTDLSKLNSKLVEAITNKNREFVAQIEELRECNLQLQSCDNWGCKVFEKKLNTAIKALEEIRRLCGTKFELKNDDILRIIEIIDGVKNAVK